jgi:hypothetical protein
VENHRLNFTQTLVMVLRQILSDKGHVSGEIAGIIKLRFIKLLDLSKSSLDLLMNLLVVKMNLFHICARI